ncbi:hypothetical protein WS66_30430 [Burkholderia sp. LA-2-3-30-S1-D2]|nr:hypothetical protein WS66_30430 [Burkholderia sp. LA-2-3-30-S1-D2]KVE18899.1 hypothetical protein WS66_28990 [Burkholderia sp. LA-2-3-30-S1-D2]
MHYQLHHWRLASNVANLFARCYVSGRKSCAVCVFCNERTVLASAKYNRSLQPPFFDTSVARDFERSRIARVLR